MKKLTIVLLGILIAFSACKKDDDNGDDTPKCSKVPVKKQHALVMEITSIT